MPVGLSSPTLLYKTVGLDLTQPAQLTLPNISGYAPGAMVSLLKFNPQTGGHDSFAQMVVSADGKTMTSTGTVTLASAPAATGASPAVRRSDNGGGSLGGGSGLQGGATGASPALDPGGSGASSSTGTGPFTYSACLIEEPGPTNNTPDSPCPLCDLMGGLFGSLDSNTGLLDGEYLQDHQTVTYQSQGQARGIDLQYSSAQADSEPIAQYQFTTPVAGDSASLTSITPQHYVAGVVQGPATLGNSVGRPDRPGPPLYPAPGRRAGAWPPASTRHMTVTEVLRGSTSDHHVQRRATSTSSIPRATRGRAGWSVGRLQQLSQVTSGGPVVIATGQEPSERFDPVYNDGQSYFQDLALASSTSTSQILANDGAGGFTATGSPSDSGVVGTAAGDFNGDGKVDQAVVDSSTLALLISNSSRRLHRRQRLRPADG